MGDYKYKVPEGSKHKISIRKWNKVFGKRGRWPFITCEVYLQDEIAHCHFVVSKFGKLFLLTAAPLYYIIGTLLEGASEAHRSYKRDLFDKEYGAFSSDVIFKGRGRSWDKLMELVWEN